VNWGGGGIERGRGEEGIKGAGERVRGRGRGRGGREGKGAAEERGRERKEGGGVNVCGVQVTHSFHVLNMSKGGFPNSIHAPRSQ
jgi:hypothetical protein